MSVTRAKRTVSEVFYLNNGFLKATTFNQKVAGRHLTLLLSAINPITYGILSFRQLRGGGGGGGLARIQKTGLQLTD